jgi:uncharacterized protein YeaC (DUF1315 family)
MNLDDLIASMTTEIYKNMKDAVELGRWGDGRTMTSEQKEFSLEAMIRYEHLVGIAETERVGYVDTSKKMNKKKSDDNDTQNIKIID